MDEARPDAPHRAKEREPALVSEAIVITLTGVGDPGAPGERSQVFGELVVAIPRETREPDEPSSPELVRGQAGQPQRELLHVTSDAADATRRIERRQVVQNRLGHSGPGMW